MPIAGIPYFTSIQTIFGEADFSPNRVKKETGKIWFFKKITYVFSIPIFFIKC